MKKRKQRKRKNERDITTVLCLAVIAVATFAVNKYCTDAVTGTAIFSAGLAMPQGAAQVIKENYLKDIGERTDETESQSVIINGNGTQSSVSVLSSAYSTPADIVLMGQNYKTEYASASHDGVIVEKQYDETNATSVFKNVTVRNTTPSHSINIEASLNEPLTLSVTDKSQPTVLIFHTHTTECYELINEGWYTSSHSTRSDDSSQNMVRVGDAICEELEKSGIGYIHDSEIHDAQYTGAYDRSRETITRILEQYPSIQIVLDVHRDAICQDDGTKIKPTAVINGVKAAQIMIIAGCEDGKVTSFPNWEQNLTFALRLQQTAESLYPGLMRPVLFSARKYNMDVVPCSALIEIGSDSSTLAEAVYSGHLIGKAISELVNNNCGGQ